MEKLKALLTKKNLLIIAGIIISATILGYRLSGCGSDTGDVQDVGDQIKVGIDAVLPDSDNSSDVIIFDAGEVDAVKAD
jgi:hypothetical protein